MCLPVKFALVQVGAPLTPQGPGETAARDEVSIPPRILLQFQVQSPSGPRQRVDSARSGRTYRLGGASGLPPKRPRVYSESR